MNRSPQLIGYWAADLRDGFALPQDFVREMPSKQQQQIVDYLESGQEWESYRGYSWCRICGINNGSHEFTDGEWVWPEGLSHYVRHHSVVLPDEIIARACGFPQKPLPPEQDDWTSFWRSWCATNSSGVMRPFLEAAMLEAARAAEIVMRDAANEMISLYGVSSVPCGKPGCDRMSLNKHYYCGQCDTEQYRESLTITCYLVGPAIDAFRNSQASLP